jgi:hypothetical protein
MVGFYTIPGGMFPRPYRQDPHRDDTCFSEMVTPCAKNNRDYNPINTPRDSRNGTPCDSHF